MCAEIVNLRQQRKRIDRRKSEQKAAENRALHGLAKGEKQREKLERDKALRQFDQGRRERGDDEA
ncbi:DUF4169 family protein [Martelella soudanensis]|uniref:DUF4169 family protein n=1 Tax=unclassified Martelella TaxID=2629616 RepID=UPI0015DE0866|nr:MULTISPECIES: DUF4169 family protein [unclassified Martelella]